ncbi:MAG: AAA family ATPase [Sedimentisphaerales bacterium]|nr:AAA family ATPase [Sedimentisphaerales bacterium]
MKRSVKILLTGPPGCGKTTAVMTIIQKLDREKATGFYTQEIRRDNVRKGFSWIRLDGAVGTLAHVDIKGRFKVGKYGVDVAGFEKAILPVLDAKQTDTELFVIDEIGKMECLSDKFTAAVQHLFASDKNILSTVAEKGGGLIKDVKRNPNVKIFQLKRKGCAKIITEILELLSSN